MLVFSCVTHGNVCLCWLFCVCLLLSSIHSLLPLSCPGLWRLWTVSPGLPRAVTSSGFGEWEAPTGNWRAEEEKLECFLPWSFPVLAGLQVSSDCSSSNRVLPGHPSSLVPTTLFCLLAPAAWRGGYDVWLPAVAGTEITHLSFSVSQPCPCPWPCPCK